MQKIKDKIKKIEAAKEQIKALEALNGTKAEHLHPCLCLKNGSNFIYGVVIEDKLFQIALSSQKAILEKSIEDDIKFIEGIELMLSSEKQPKAKLKEPLTELQAAPVQQQCTPWDA